MNKLHKIISVSALLVVGISANAAISQSDALEMIINNNPTIRTMTAGVMADAIGSKGVAQLPGLEIDGEYMFNQSGGTNKWSVGISQGFDWPGAYGARKRSAQAATDAGLLEIEALKRETSLKAQLLMNEGVYATLRLNTLKNLYNNLDSVSHSISYGYEHGELTVLDLKKIKIEMFKLDNEINDANVTITRVNNELRAMAGNADIEVDLNEYMPLPLLDYATYESYLDNDPTVVALMARANASRLEADAAKASRAPSFSLGYRHAYEEGDHFNGITASIGLPRWGHNYESDYNIAKSDVAKLQATLSTDTNRQTLRGDYDTAQKYSRLMNGYSKVVLDDEYADLLVMAYRGGQINVITMIQEINYYLESSLDYLSNDYAYRDALARINIYAPRQ